MEEVAVEEELLNMHYQKHTRSEYHRYRSHDFHICILHRNHLHYMRPTTTHRMYIREVPVESLEVGREVHY